MQKLILMTPFNFKRLKQGKFKLTKGAKERLDTVNQILNGIVTGKTVVLYSITKRVHKETGLLIAKIIGMKGLRKGKFSCHTTEVNFFLKKEVTFEVIPSEVEMGFGDTTIFVSSEKNCRNLAKHFISLLCKGDVGMIRSLPRSLPQGGMIIIDLVFMQLTDL